MTTRNNTKPDFYQEITNQIVKSLESGIKPWVCPWDTSCSSGLPINALTNNPYQGMNIMLLWMSAAERGFSSRYWLTFKQAKEMGGNVRKGENGTKIFFYSLVKKKDSDDENDTYSMLKTYTVFNLDQVDGIEKSESEFRFHNQVEQIDAIERFIEHTNASITYVGVKAFYRPSTDQIVMPSKERFSSTDGLYATLLHELTHWTSHKSRLDRQTKGAFGSKDYAFEELIAELGCAFLMVGFGLDGEMEQHQCYIADWLTALKNDKRYIFKAAAQASKAHQFLMDMDTELAHQAVNQ